MSARAKRQDGKLPLHAAAHEPFSFLDSRLKFNTDAQFAATVKDFAEGIGLCMEMVYKSTLDREMNENSDPVDERLPLLDRMDTGRLLRFANASSNMLAEYAQDRIEWMNKHRAKLAPKEEGAN